MEIGTQRRGAIGPLDAGGAFDAAQARDVEAGRVLIVDDDAAVRLVCALEKARCRRPDVVLTDVKAERARALGALAYLTKPFDLRALALFVAHALVAPRAGSSELTAPVATQPRRIRQ